VVGDIEGEVLTHDGKADESNVGVRFGHKGAGELPIGWRETNLILRVQWKKSRPIAMLGGARSGPQSVLLLGLVGGFRGEKRGDFFHQRSHELRLVALVDLTETNPGNRHNARRGQRTAPKIASSLFPVDRSNGRHFSDPIFLTKA
jgi:hypothetical protein